MRRISSSFNQNLPLSNTFPVWRRSLNPKLVYEAQYLSWAFSPPPNTPVFRALHKDVHGIEFRLAFSFSRLERLPYSLGNHVSPRLGHLHPGICGILCEVNILPYSSLTDFGIMYECICVVYIQMRMCACAITRGFDLSLEMAII